MSKRAWGAGFGRWTRYANQKKLHKLMVLYCEALYVADRFVHKYNKNMLSVLSYLVTIYQAPPNPHFPDYLEKTNLPN
jgi:hypothetical protein